MATPLELWVEEHVKLAKPDKVHWCDGSDEEAHRLIEIGMKEERINGEPVFRSLDQKVWPNAFFHRSHPTDVARTEHLTFICHPEKEMAGPNNNWMDPREAKERMRQLFDGCMKGRTMYVMPFMMGDPASSYAKPCVQLTDNSYVAVSMRIMTRVGKEAITRIGSSTEFFKGAHSIGDLDPNKRFIMHFPQDGLVWSVGSGYGGNALLGKKCISLRLASCLGFKEGWLAEHMVVLGIEDPKGRTTYMTAAMPSACGKTNLAMLQSALPGYKVWTLGDDIAWLNIGPDGRLWAINPEAGLFGVAPGTSMKTNPNMIKTLKASNFYPTLYTNTALDTEANVPWWEGLDGAVPSSVLDWQGHAWAPGAEGKAAHPNSRFTVSIRNCPTLAKAYDDPRGVPISAIIFGGRRTHLIPLVMEAFDWAHGVFLGARTGSETTAAATSQAGVLRRDPMSMLPFCGYNMGDYFAHWVRMGTRIKNPPKIFSVNWFRLNEAGKFIWPGFGDNIRVLKWIIERVNGEVGAHDTAIGRIPELKDLDLTGLNIAEKDLKALFEVHPLPWQGEVADIEKFMTQFGDKMPRELWVKYEELKMRLSELV